MTKVFFEVLRKERGFLTIYAIIVFLGFLFGVHNINEMLLRIISSLILVTIAHNQYKSLSEKVFCVSLAIFCVSITMIAGMNILFVMVNLFSSIITGFVLLALRNIFKKV